MEQEVPLNVERYVDSKVTHSQMKTITEESCPTGLWQPGDSKQAGLQSS